MTLLERQWVMASLTSKLIAEAIRLGYRVRLGEAYRSQEYVAWQVTQGKHVRSLHAQRLAIDLLFDRDGVALTEPADYAPLGTWWELQHPLARWGGRFAYPVLTHFSLVWDVDD